MELSSGPEVAVVNSELPEIPTWRESPRAAGIESAQPGRTDEAL
jgi:hypothetical protein